LESRKCRRIIYVQNYLFAGFLASPAVLVFIEKTNHRKYKIAMATWIECEIKHPHNRPLKIAARNCTKVIASETSSRNNFKREWSASTRFSPGWCNRSANYVSGEIPPSHGMYYFSFPLPLTRMAVIPEI